MRRSAPAPPHEVEHAGVRLGDEVVGVPVAAELAGETPRGRSVPRPELRVGVVASRTRELEQLGIGAGRGAR